MTDVATLEAEVKEFKLQLETVQTSLQADPENQELLSLQSELEEFISLTEQSIAELRPAAPPPQPKPQPQKQEPPSRKPSTSTPGAALSPVDAAAAAASEIDRAIQAREQEQQQQQQAQTQQVYKVNDTVLARWVSGDGSFYPAKITTVTGSRANPMYIVSFKKYHNVETVQSKDVKPLPSAAPAAGAAGPAAATKRKADVADATVTSSASGAAGISPVATHAPSSTVISAAAEINPELASAARNQGAAAGGEEKPARPGKAAKKVRATKQLEEGKMKWQEFANKSKFAKKAGKKESMFRTGEGPKARVGFTGSGQQMRKDPTRTKHVYQRQDDDY